MYGWTAPLPSAGLGLTSSSPEGWGSGYEVSSGEGLLDTCTPSRTDHGLDHLQQV